MTQSATTDARTLYPAGQGLGFAPIPPPYLHPDDVQHYCKVHRISPGSKAAHRLHCIAQQAHKRAQQWLAEHADKPSIAELTPSETAHTPPVAVHSALESIDRKTGVLGRLFARGRVSFVDLHAEEGSASAYLLRRAAETGVLDRTHGIAVTFADGHLATPAAIGVPEKLAGNVVVVRGRRDAWRTVKRAPAFKAVKETPVALVVSLAGMRHQAFDTIVRESLAMLTVLGKGGDFVLALPTANVTDQHPLLSALVYFLHRYFDDSTIVAPVAQYLVCRGFKSTNPAGALAFLKRVDRRLRRLQTTHSDDAARALTHRLLAGFIRAGRRADRLWPSLAYFYVFHCAQHRRPGLSIVASVCRQYVKQWTVLDKLVRQGETVRPFL